MECTNHLCVVCFFSLLPMYWCSWAIFPSLFGCIQWICFHRRLQSQPLAKCQNERIHGSFAYGTLDHFIVGYFLLLVSFFVFILFGNAVARMEKNIGRLCQNITVVYTPIREWVLWCTDSNTKLWLKLTWKFNKFYRNQIWNCLFLKWKVRIFGRPSTSTSISTFNIWYVRTAKGFYPKYTVRCVIDTSHWIKCKKCFVD